MILILSVLAFIASSCGNKTTKKSFDLSTFPSMLQSLERYENGDLVVDENVSLIVYEINGNKFIQHYCARVDETGYDESDFEYEIVETYQIADTIFFKLKDEAEAEYLYKFIWLDKKKELFGLLIGDNDVQIYVSKERLSEYPIKKYEVLVRRKVKHHYKEPYIHNKKTEINFVFFEDGTISMCSDCNWDDSVLELQEPNREIDDLPEWLFIDNNKNNGIKFFDDFGLILEGWKIINFHKVNSRKQITNFEINIEKIAKSNIQDINEKCLIIIKPEFDNNSEDAGEIAADWDYYANETGERYKAMGLKTVYAEKRYLSFALADGGKIVIDTKKGQNGQNIPPSALLYKKGQIPIIIIISGESEESNKMIKEYLR